MSDLLDCFFNRLANIIDKYVKNEKLNSALKKLFGREIVLYIVCGVLTTAVNFVSLYASLRLFGLTDAINEKAEVNTANIIAWIIAVLFAYFTNKLLVFESKSFEKKVVIKEFSSFTLARLFSLGVEEAGLFILNTLLNFNVYFVKIVLAIIVILLNYALSKYIIFKNKNKIEK